jgi:hypothetical protein
MGANEQTLPEPGNSWRGTFKREWPWLLFLAGSLICAVVTAVTWSWNVYVCWVVIWGLTVLARVACVELESGRL